MTRSKYIKLCIKSLNENITPSEKEKLKNWLESSEKNRIQFNTICKVWDSTCPDDPSFIPDKYVELNRLRDSIDYKTEKVTYIPSNFSAVSYIKSGLNYKYRFVFAITLVFLLVMGGRYLIFDRNSSVIFTEIVTRNKQITQIRLPDSSSVKINSGSILRYATEFLVSDRKVFLEGEAFFYVVGDKGKFEVETQNARIVVIGTRFNVFSRSGVTKVIVKDGIVQIDSKRDKTKTIQLAKGYMGSVEKKNIPSSPKEVNTDYLLGWMNGILVFEKTPLYEIIGELQRFYDIKIEIINVELNDKTITASYDNSEIEDVLSSISLALNAHFIYESGKYKIY